MPNRSLQTFDSTNFFGPIILCLYLCIGFVPNLEAVDKIAPQWLCMSIINLLSLVYFIYNRKSLGLGITSNLKALLSLTYIAFIIWALVSILYAINPIEVIVNISRQVNVLLMFLSMSVFLFFLKEKLRFIPWLISLILGIEIYSVLNEALGMLNTIGYINSGELKGVTANRNITAFSLAIKIPFVLFLIHLLSKTWLKLILSFLICMAILGLSMIQSRASFIAVGLIFIAYTALQIVLFLRENKRFSQLLNLGYFLIPLLLAITINQATLSDKGADAISRAATISLSTNDGSVNQRLRYYEDVLTHLLKNPIFGVGLGNWKLKSIDYDSKDIVGYVVPYHAHSDFIQLGAELGIIGFLLYLGIFIWALYYVYILIRFSDLEVNEKVFLFLIITSLGVYSVDANLNFPIARPQVLVVWTLIMGIITVYFQKYKGRLNLIKSNNTILGTQCESYNKLNIKDINVVTGFRPEKVDTPNIKTILNKNYEKTGELYSLNLCRDIFEKNIIISYGDIIFKDYVLSELLKESSDISIVVDSNWTKKGGNIDYVKTSVPYSKKLFNSKVKLKSISTKLSQHDINGEFIGISKFSEIGVKELIFSLDKLSKRDNFKKMSLNDLFEDLIERIDIAVVFINDGWLDIDTIFDLEKSEEF